MKIIDKIVVSEKEPTTNDLWIRNDENGQPSVNYFSDNGWEQLNTNEIPVASSTTIGGVKIGEGINVTADGTISASKFTLEAATAAKLGGVKIGTGISVTEDGTISAQGGSQVLELTGLPDTSMTTLEELAATGLTPEIIADAAKGKYTTAHYSVGSTELTMLITASVSSEYSGLNLHIIIDSDSGPRYGGLSIRTDGDTVSVENIE